MASKVSAETALRWTLTQAAKEFQVPRETLRRKLGEVHEEPGPDGTFTTTQLVKSLYGELYLEKVRTQREVARKLELENAVTVASVLNRAELMKGLAAIADAIICRIMASDLSRPAKEDLLKDIASIPIVLTNVARAQTGLSVRGNGQAPEEDAAQ